ncbi:MAG: flagellar filament capping protein FliD [Acetobacteraceae bacterium]|nr:flagellar filament capping protein FliD [Acetobacteraceae bacterium]
MRVSGLASSLDWEALIASLMALERRPITLMTERRDGLLATRTAWLDINARLGEIKAKAYGLKQEAAFGTLLVESGDEAVVVGTATTEARPGTFDVTVASLAQAHKVASDAQADNTSPLGLTGTFQVNGIGVTVAAGDSLAAVSDKINQAEAGVTASLVGTTLVLTRDDTGSTPISLVDDPGTDILTQLGVFDALDQFKHQLAAAQDASFTVDTLSFTRSSNVVSDVIPGVTFTLKKASSTPVSLRVVTDVDHAVSAVKDFVAAYNAALDTIAEELGSGGRLRADPTLVGIQWDLRRMVSEPVSGLPSTLDRLSQVGVTAGDTAGHLTVDEEALRAAIEADPAGVAAIFQEGTGGVAVRLHDYLGALTQTGGLILGSADSLQERADRIDEDIRQLEARLKLQEEALYRQYTQMEVTISTLQNQSAWLAAQSNVWFGSP